MGIFSRTKTIVAHDGKFHADDVFAVAALKLLGGGRGKVVRTRDEKVIAAADYVVDVGGVYDPLHNRFDHHMPEGAGFHVNGIPYAAFGLVWKQYGIEIAGSRSVADRIDTKLVSPIDADDNGVSLVTPIHEIVPYGLHNFLYTYRPTWKEDPKIHDTAFMELVSIAMRIIQREIKIAADAESAQSLVEDAYQKAEDKRIIVLDGSYPYQETIQTHKEPLYVVSPRSGDTKWKVETVHAKPFGFENRKSLPSAWAGLRDGELAKMTGVADAVFCHRALFLAVAETKAGALELARIAANS